jgi:hypothetical protein
MSPPSEQFFHEKPMDFKVLWLKLAFPRRARRAYPATEAISVEIAEKRKYLAPKCEQTLDSCPW